MDKVVETLSAPKKTRFVQRVSFQCLILTFRPPLPFSIQCCNQVKVSTERIATLKRGRGGLAINATKKMLSEVTDGRRKKAFVLLKCVNTFVHDCLKLPLSENK